MVFLHVALQVRVQQLQSVEILLEPQLLRLSGMLAPKTASLGVVLFQRRGTKMVAIHGDIQARH